MYGSSLWIFIYKVLVVVVVVLALVVGLVPSNTTMLHFDPLSRALDLVCVAVTVTCRSNDHGEPT